MNAKTITVPVHISAKLQDEGLLGRERWWQGQNLMDFQALIFNKTSTSERRQLPDTGNEL